MTAAFKAADVSRQPSLQQKLLVVGNGMGSVRFLEKLVEQSGHQYQVTVLSEEPCPGYNRIQLSRLLAGSVDLQGIQLQPESWYQDQDINLLSGSDYRVSGLDLELKRVETEGGQWFDYDHLVLATGSLPNRIPVPGADLEGVMAFRTLDDVEQMLTASSSPEAQAVVIGGGLLGLECASGLARRGMKVIVVDTMSIPMARQLDKKAGKLLQSALEEKGIEFRCNAMLDSYTGENGRVTGVQLKDGECLQASLVVVTAGVRPNIELIRETGLECDRGILVNDRMQTSDPSVTAIGECVQLNSDLFGLVAPVYGHAQVAVHRLLGTSGERFEPVPIPTSLKVDGIDLFSSGQFVAQESDEEIIIDAAGVGIYRKLVIRDHKLMGALLFGDASDGLWYQELMETGQDISDIRDRLVFGKRYLNSGS
ncbi:NAD(P)/FAD-dependent oxidoreductase [Endozoicomonas sp. 8E]|uniref:NAD(P)/FAD-dependent oxidoreductase n=1 Tax=Endozoicomonas sp. 8E TaxID=3035692 RepID=UPI002938F9F0|nr:FAD-dependent oxidoreductase [Endozoicomonas sp. 8E]WOG29832.1 FAD-dependent oxidoreductase [Endozoicomonas sp. 8E]